MKDVYEGNDDKTYSTITKDEMTKVGVHQSLSALFALSPGMWVSIDLFLQVKGFYKACMDDTARTNDSWAVVFVRYSLDIVHIRDLTVCLHNLVVSKYGRV